MSYLSRKFWTASVGVLCLAAGSIAQSATVTIIGGADIDISYDDAQPGISTYGAPILLPNSNNIAFQHVGFNVTSSNGEGAVSLASTVDFTITRKNGLVFESLTLFEFGNYTMSGAGTSVNVSGSMSVSTPNGIFGPNTDPVPQISPNGTMNIADGGAHNWNGGASADLTVPGSGFGGFPDAWSDEASIVVSINNILTATTTQAGTTAFIQKLQSGEAVMLGVNGDPEANPVPVPAAVWLFGSGLICLAGVARRKAG